MIEKIIDKLVEKGLFMYAFILLLVWLFLYYGIKAWFIYKTHDRYEGKNPCKCPFCHKKTMKKVGDYHKGSTFFEKWGCSSCKEIKIYKI